MNAQRQEFLTRGLNAAANLYGVVSYGEFIKLYNRYAADKASPVSDLLRALGGRAQDGAAEARSA